MKKTFILITLMVTCLCTAQTVSTFFSNPDVIIDDAMVQDSEGNLYGSNFAGNSVYKITPDGTQTTFATGFANPNGLAFDSEENLFIVEYSAQKIHKYSHDGTLLQSFDVTDGFPSNIIKSHDSDAMIFTNVSDHSINKLEQDGTITKLFAGEPLDVPVGLTYDNQGRLYIGNYLNRKIYRLKNNGVKYIATIPDSGTVFPYLAFITYANKLLWATNYGEQKIYTVRPNKIDDVAIFSGSTIGTDDGDFTEATYTYPAGIIYDENEDALYVSQYFNGSVRKISDISDYKRPKIKFNVFPNPAHYITFVKGKLPAPGDYNISIFDSSGNLVYEANESTAYGNIMFKKIKISDLNITNPSGTFIVKVSTETISKSKLLIIY